MLFSFLLCKQTCIIFCKRPTSSVQILNCRTFTSRQLGGGSREHFSLLLSPLIFKLVQKRVDETRGRGIQIVFVSTLCAKGYLLLSVVHLLFLPLGIKFAPYFRLNTWGKDRIWDGGMNVNASLGFPDTSTAPKKKVGHKKKKTFSPFLVLNSLFTACLSLRHSLSFHIFWPSQRCNFFQIWNHGRSMIRFSTGSGLQRLRTNCIREHLGMMSA